MLRPTIEPETVASTCVCLALRRAARNVSRHYDDALRPLRINNGQFSMLTMIAGIQPIAIGMLAETLVMDRTTVTAALKPLIREGWVRLAVSTADARGRDAMLTASGLALVKRAIPRWEAAQDDLRRGLSEARTSALMRSLADLG